MVRTAEFLSSTLLWEEKIVEFMSFTCYTENIQQCKEYICFIQ